jgi:hypothetical protein
MRDMTSEGTHMTRLAIIFVVCLACIACRNEQTPPAQVSAIQAAASVQQCGKDTDCKGERICESGSCVFQAARVASPADPAPAASSLDGGVPVCQQGDGKTRIPVWMPDVDAKNNLSSEPPQKDGQIIYIRVHADIESAGCTDDTLNSFSLPANKGDRTQGGLAVNLKGNTQLANGMCHFSGYYMNEEVMGMHQGWIETYFGALDKKAVVLPGKYCLSESID